MCTIHSTGLRRIHHHWERVLGSASSKTSLRTMRRSRQYEKFSTYVPEFGVKGAAGGNSGVSLISFVSLCPVGARQTRNVLGRSLGVGKAKDGARAAARIHVNKNIESKCRTNVFNHLGWGVVGADSVCPTNTRSFQKPAAMTPYPACRFETTYFFLVFTTSCLAVPLFAMP